MQFWFTRGSEITLREQLVTQVRLSILCGDLKAGERLPSTREVARRFGLHPNTVSAGYRQLEQEGWLVLRRGSGVFVRKTHPEALTPALLFDRKIAELFHAGRVLKLPLNEVRARLAHWLQRQIPDHFLLIEPDDELRSIVLFEMTKALTMQVRGTAGERLSPSETAGCVPVVLPSKSDAVRKALPSGLELITLQIRSVTQSLGHYLPAQTHALVGIASRWDEFVKLARTMLLASGFSPESLVIRDAKRQNWQRGLNQVTAVVCDFLTAESLRGRVPVLAFPLLADSSLQELKRYEEYLKSPFQSSL